MNKWNNTQLSMRMKLVLLMMPDLPQYVQDKPHVPMVLYIRIPKSCFTWKTKS